MEKPAAQLARRLADTVESVCRHYLSKGRRDGRYWLVGDVHNTPGQSLYVRLVASPEGHGDAGKWTDAATGEHGDLLDLIAKRCGHATLRETLDEARRFLAMPIPPPPIEQGPRREPKAPTGSPEAAQRLFAASGSIAGSVVESYLRGRALTDLRRHGALRFHPRCWYRPSKEDAPDVRNAWPALICAVTDLDGRITGVQRGWIDPETLDKAPVTYPRRAMGHLLGNGVRFGQAGEVMLFGEGVETTLSLKRLMPALPMIAGLSARHLAAVTFPPALRRLYVAREVDPASDVAWRTLTDRAEEAGIEIAPLEPMLDDANADLRRLGPKRLAAHLRPQLIAADADRFLTSPR
jgi:hypothetical protein